MKVNIVQGMRDARRLVQKAGPYVLLEIVLPGGTLFALLLYLYRSGQLRSLADVRALGKGALRTAGQIFDQLAFVWQPAPGDTGLAPGRRGWSAPQLLLPGR